ncbi:MAG TPA: thioredoxin family protein [Saprospiraceae bacterium]|nr:thioredoxin family protein [Saprospiraceae bacterium]
MARIWMLLLVLFSCLSVVVAGPGLERGAFEKAQQEARDQGKFLFVDFYAPWCNPCQWMDENTFKDAEVLGILQKDFITLRVNIDDMEGFEMKSRFDIRFLPTVLVFNAEGVMVERKEETLGPKKMKGMLTGVLEKNIQQPIVHKVNTSPSMAFTASAPDIKVEKKEEVISGQFLVQLGAFTHESNAKKQSETWSKLLQKQVSVKKEERQGKVLYRVISASFGSKEEADQYKETLKNTHQLQAVVL